MGVTVETAGGVTGVADGAGLGFLNKLHALRLSAVTSTRPMRKVRKCFIESSSLFSIPGFILAERGKVEYGAK